VATRGACGPAVAMVPQAHREYGPIRVLEPVKTNTRLGPIKGSSSCSIRFRVRRRKVDMKTPPTELAEGVHFSWSTRPGSNRRPPRWQRVPTPGFCCIFPRNRRREPHWARPRSGDATRALRAPPGTPESGGGSPTHARAYTGRSSVCRVIARALRNRRLAGLAPERGGS